MFFRIFENFRDASQNEIEALIQENTVTIGNNVEPEKRP